MIVPASLPPLTAIDVVRGVSRLLLRWGVAPMAEVPIGCGRRADIMGIDAAGRLTIIEIKVSLADLRGDRKWPDYLAHCDRFYWAVPVGFGLAPFENDDLAPERTGLIIADRFDAEAVRPAPWQPLGTPLSPARRKAETLAFARRAAHRVLGHVDPEAGRMRLD